MKANFSAQLSLPRNMVYLAKEEVLLGRTVYVDAICVLVSLPFHLSPQINIYSLYGCSESDTRLSYVHPVLQRKTVNFAWSV